MKNYKNSVIQKMQLEKLSQISIDNFLYYYDFVIKKFSSKISDDTISNPIKIKKYINLENKYEISGDQKKSNVVMIRLNGGLGTSMGLKKAKSLLKVKDGYSFLDIIAKQVEHIGIPLILMNSYNTQSDSLESMEKFDFLKKQNIQIDFLQNRIPKISIETGKPVEYKQNPDLEWCPPGHGDIYVSLLTSGILDDLLEKGFEYAFISNADNLGATFDRKILGYCIENNIPFLMEVAQRTETDKKGGHLAISKSGQLILREIAQCKNEEISDFQNVHKYTYFNTNNIWINLQSLKNKLIRTKGNLKLPLIQNRKNVNPRDENSEDVFQLETAMGSAIQIFKNSEAILVPRNRFIPVKKSEDLLKIKSDLYKLDDKFNLIKQM